METTTEDVNRHALTDAEWEAIKPVAEYKPARGPKPEHIREYLDGICWILATGAPWRDMPTYVGDWSKVYDRFRAYLRRGLFQQILTQLQQNASRRGNLRLEIACFDGTYVRAHRHAAGARKKTAVATPPRRN